MQMKGSWGWLVVTAAVLGCDPADPPRNETALSRTRELIRQKVASLKAYNEYMPLEDLLAYYSKHFGHTVEPEAFAELSEQVTGQILPRLWRESQRRSGAGRFVSNHAMAEVIEELYPQQQFQNGDVLLFPHSNTLRVIVTEPTQDFFRDSAWHWKWLGLYLDEADPDERAKLKDLDVYGAEALSEFLSVIGVAIFQLACQQAPEVDTAISTWEARAILDQIERRAARRSPRAAAAATEKFSKETKQKILDTLPSPMFRDVTDEVGMTFRHAIDERLREVRARKVLPLGIAGGGVASGDYDGDGYPDLFFSGSGGGRLYRNDAGRRFEDVTGSAGLNLEGESRAGYFIDYDNDGDLDLFITFFSTSNRLWENDGSGRFTDVTAAVGLDSGRDSTHEAVWFDMDNDGLLDLYTANFGAWQDVSVVPTLGRMNINGLPNRLYHHSLEDGKHRFTEIAAKAGVDDPGWTHCVGAWDVDRDGRMDLMSLNDFSGNHVFRNVGGGRFESVARDLHMDITYNAMNFTLFDLNRDGLFEVYVSEITKLVHTQRYIRPAPDTPMVFTPENIKNTRILSDNKLYQDLGNGRFDDILDGTFEPAALGWAWDASTMDYENDGDPDMLILNGTELEPPKEPGEHRADYKDGRYYISQHSNQRNVFYLSQNEYFYDVSDRCPLAYRGNSRGSTFFDFDRDGDLDVAINDFCGPARIFRNEQQTGNAWVGFRLQGSSSNRNAIGARVKVVEASGRVQYDVVVSGSGFLSQNPMELHFGLGPSGGVSKVVVVWPSGTVQTIDKVEVNRVHPIVEP